ncbi:MAG TPA: hypothetical protein ACFYD6_03920 [Candidatus Brocadiia bacterium]|nr:hypothetical protein [Candidatus Brocadiales bacterium]
MKKVSLILGTLIVFTTVVCFLSASTFAGKAADWPMGASGYVKYQVIEGTVKSVDAQNHCLFIEGSDILGDESLCVGSNTMIYKGSEKTNLEDVRGAAQFTEADRLDFNALGVGYRIKATFSIIGGKYVAETLCLIR